MDSTPLSDLLPWKTRDPANDSFWDLYRRLGECHSDADAMDIHGCCRMLHECSMLHLLYHEAIMKH